MLLNKIDLLSPGERRESVQFTAEALAELLGGPVKLFPVSAREAQRGDSPGAGARLERSGFPAFTQTLATFLMEEKGAALTAVAARRLAHLAAQARFNVALERESLATPLEELRRRLGLFKEKKQEALHARLDYGTLIESEARRLVHETVDPDVEAFQRRLTQRIDASIERRWRESRHLSSRRLHAALEQLVTDEVRTACEEFRVTEDEKVAQAFDALCARFTNPIDATVDELRRFAADLFAIPFSPVPAESPWKFESGFYYKFWTEPPSLEILLSSAVLALPRILGARLVRRRIQRRAADLVEIHAGRLRYDLAQRIEQGGCEFRTLIVERIDDTIAGIEAAVRRGLDAGQATEREIQVRTEALLAAARTFDEVQSGIERVQDAVSDAFSFDSSTPEISREAGSGAADATKAEGIEGGPA